MDPTACNFSPVYSIDNGNCSFCEGDLNLDCSVSFSDLFTVISEFGCIGCSFSDLNNDGMVSSIDITAILSLYGSDCYYQSLCIPIAQFWIKKKKAL